MATSRNLYPDGLLLMEKAREIAKHLEIPDGIFKASKVGLNRERRGTTSNRL